MDAPHWPVWLRLAFRFTVCFFSITTLYLAVSHVGTLIPFARTVADAIAYRGLLAAYQWGVARRFGPGIVYETPFGFIAYLTTALVGAAVGAIVWSIVDWRRASYARAHGVLRIYLRYLLAAVALSYGAIKVIPVQFPPPSLVALLTPLGEFTPMRLLWHFMGTSPGYTVFTGLVEVVGRLLLFSRRTTTLGALILAAAFANVTLLNFGYDVGVQFNTTIYALMAMVLIAPDAKRLAATLFANSHVTVGPRRLTPWISGLTKSAIVVAIIAIHFHDAYRSRSVVAAPLPALYGIYDVEDFERDGVRVPPGDGTRWRRFVIGERASGAIQLTPHSPLVLFNVTDDPDASVLRLTGRTKGSPVLTFQYARSADGLLEIVGLVDDHLVRARLKAIDVRQLPLLRPRR